MATAILMTCAVKAVLDITVIQIIPTGQNSSASKGLNVHVSSIVKNNNRVYDLAAMKPDGWYTIWDTQIENYGDKDHPLIIKTHRYDSLQITFFNNPYMGIVEIKTADKEYRLDLYTPNEYGTTSIDIPFVATESASWPVSLTAGICVAALMVGFLLFLRYAKSRGLRQAAAAVAGCAAAWLLLRTHADFGRLLNICFLISYGVFSAMVLPDIVQSGGSCFAKNKALFTAQILICACAAAASLYTQLIRPHNSFHFGLYGIGQFADIFVYWFLFLSVVMRAMEGLLQMQDDQKSER